MNVTVSVLNIQRVDCRLWSVGDVIEKNTYCFAQFKVYSIQINKLATYLSPSMKPLRFCKNEIIKTVTLKINVKSPNYLYNLFTKA